MITLSLLKFLEDSGFGKIDKSLFWQKMTLDRKGIYISDVGEGLVRGRRRAQSYILHARGDTDIESRKILEEVVDFLNNSYEVCSLPAVPPASDKKYDNITIMPVSSITNVGLDGNNRLVFSATGTIYY